MGTGSETIKENFFQSTCSWILECKFDDTMVYVGIGIWEKQDFKLLIIYSIEYGYLDEILICWLVLWTIWWFYVCIRELGQASGKNIFIIRWEAFIWWTFLPDTIINIISLVKLILNYQIYSQLPNLYQIYS